MYPFRPKSTASLRAGQYWTFELKDGTVCCGVVVARVRRDGKIHTRLFLAGLLDWVSDSPPAGDDLKGRKIRELGYAHLKAITETGGEVSGEMIPCWNMPDVVSNDDAISTWGYNVIRVIAEKIFGKNRANQTAETTAVECPTSNHGSLPAVSHL